MNTIELYHHGILGMKWGQRNGPPYPLGAGDHSASEKKAGWRKSLDKKASDNKIDKKTSKKTGLNSRGTKAVGSILADVGDKSVGSFGVQSYASKGKAIVNSYITDNVPLKRKERDFSFSEDLSAVNPNFDPNDIQSAWNYNCGHCVTAYEYRRRGFDVAATPITKKEMQHGGVLMKEYKEFFPGISFHGIGSPSAALQTVLLGGAYTPVSDKEYNALCRKLEVFGNGARGFVAGYYRTGGGHIFSWEVENGRVRFVDSQNSKADASEYFQDGRFTTGTLKFARVDNLKMNTEPMSKYAMNRR